MKKRKMSIWTIVYLILILLAMGQSLCFLIQPCSPYFL